MTSDTNQYNGELLKELLAKFKSRFGSDATVISYAPGRVEVLGNHTDYNEGYVLSAAINTGTFFFISPTKDGKITLRAENKDDEIEFNAQQLVEEAKSGKVQQSKDHDWSNYVKGVLIEILKLLGDKSASELGFNALFAGDLQLGLGLSSSAALEVSSAKAIAAFYGVELEKKQMAKIGQKSEHTYVGVKCGLLDQISSIYGKKANLVKTDFRSLEVENVPLHDDICFLICNTKVSHSLVTSEYNERRESCEAAASFFKGKKESVTHLRDVNSEELAQHKKDMEQKHHMRAAHVIGENERVLKGQKYLLDGHLDKFGELMFESHHSSINNFENSCKELDQIVSIAKSTPEVLGARLSGGGFGGAALVLIHKKDKDTVAKKLEDAYQKAFGTTVEIAFIVPSDGATLIRG